MAQTTIATRSPCRCTERFDEANKSSLGNPKDVIKTLDFIVK